MNIALVWPKSTFLDNPMVWPPLGLWYLSAQLEAQGHITEFIDLNFQELPRDGEYDQLWLSATSPQMMETQRIAQEVSGWTKTKSCLGGAGAWANPDTHKVLPFNLIVAGESDHPDSIRKIVEFVNKSEYEFITIPTSKTLDWVLPPNRRWALNYHSYMLDQNTGIKHRMSSLFTARGCPMECAFCIEENQKVLMADWTYKPIKDVKIGDMVMSMKEGNRANSIIVPTKVINVINNGKKKTVKIKSNKQVLECTPNHKLYVDDSHRTRWKRADSSIPGKTRVKLFVPAFQDYSDDYKRGWLFGYISGDGCIHLRNNKTQITVTSRDIEMLDILQKWGAEFGCNLRRFKHMMGNGIFPTKLDSKYIDGVQCTSGPESDKFLLIISNDNNKRDYYFGWLAGMYDSDGTLDVGGSCRILQSETVKPHNTAKIEKYLDLLGLSYNVQKRNGLNNYVINDFLFLSTCKPLMKRKYPKHFGYKSLPKYFIDDIVESDIEKQVYDLTTENHSFICEGFIVHNCESSRHGIIWDRLTRYESLDIVEKQIREITEQGFTGLAWYDDIMPLNKKRTLAIMELQRKYNQKFRCFLRTDIICKQGGRDYLQQLKDGGLIEIFVGVESADNQIKNNIHKGNTIEHDTAVLEWCKELGITMKCSFIFGLPGENYESLNTTRDWILKYRPDRVQCDRLIPFSGTPLGDHPENFDIQYEKQPDVEWFYKGRMDLDSHSFVSTSHLSREQIDEFWHAFELELQAEGLHG